MYLGSLFWVETSCILEDCLDDTGWRLHVSWTMLLEAPCLNRKDRPRTKIFWDGNRSWESHAKSLGIPHAKVCHQNKEWTKKIRGGKAQHISKVAGTQIADRGWLSLKQCIPKSFPRRLGTAKEVKEHPDIQQLVQQFMWRKNLGPCTPNVLLAHLCKAARQVR